MAATTTAKKPTTSKPTTSKPTTSKPTAGKPTKATKATGKPTTGKKPEAKKEVKQFNPALCVGRDVANRAAKKYTQFLAQKLLEQKPGTAGRGGIRESYRGVPKCIIIRYLASQGYEAETCYAVLNLFGAAMVPGVMSTMQARGRHDDYEQEITDPEIRKELIGMAKQVAKKLA